MIDVGAFAPLSDDDAVGLEAVEGLADGALGDAVGGHELLLGGQGCAGCEVTAGDFRPDVVLDELVFCECHGGLLWTAWLTSVKLV